MRIIFIDMHCVNFLTKTFRQIRMKSKTVPYKHKFLVDYALDHGIEICNYITGRDYDIWGLGRLKKTWGGFDKSRSIALWEHNYVIRDSYGDKRRIRAIRNKDEIRRDDIIIGYLCKGYHLEILSELRGYKVLMGNHFISINQPVDLSEYHIHAFVNEIFLKENAFVKTYIQSPGVEHIVCPYVFAGRFINQHRERKNKLMATGSLSTCKGNPGYRLYRDFFGTEWIQPMRKEIFDKAAEYPAEIDSYISYIYEDKKEIRDSDSVLKRWMKRLYNRFEVSEQRRYTSFDMADKFNEYQMFACPEELAGMPGIGAIEGMACGTAYIGLEHEMYRGLGLIPGIHYISYDGSFDDFIGKIRYYQLHTEEAAQIAEQGESFIREHFNEDEVARTFFDALKEIAK